MARLPDINEWANDAAEKGIETIKNILAEKYNLTIEKIAELAKAESDGLLIRLPCKIGDAVYRDIGGNKFIEWTIEQIVIFGDEIIFTDDSDNEFHADDIGKTVFFTLPEARQTLKDLEGTK